ncbi:hypothetical protein LP419_07545 [Massilia sp. H-1]|nr:hypothetical protein LP419_07545 [Massilia sp. H-1]
MRTGSGQRRCLQLNLSYLVTLHTQAYSGESGLLDFGMGGNADAPSAFATLANFSGAFETEFDRSPSTSGDLAAWRDHRQQRRLELPDPERHPGRRPVVLWSSSAATSTACPASGAICSPWCCTTLA